MSVVGFAAEVSVSRRTAGTAIAASGLVALVAVNIPNALVFDDVPRLYPWTGAVFALVVIAVGASLARFQRADFRRAAAAVGLVAAAQVAGLGIVGIKHWEPLTGMGGGGESLWALRPLAALLALAGAAAAALCLYELVRSGAFGWTGRSWPQLAIAAVGLVIVVLVPLRIANGDPELTDFTSLGAFALIYSLPWGLSLVVASRLSAVASVACALAVAGSVVLQMAGPPMDGLLFTSSHYGFTFTLVAAIVAAALRFRPRSAG